jgi:hypothetical protein
MNGDEKDEDQGYRLPNFSQSTMQATATWAAKLHAALSA